MKLALPVENDAQTISIRMGHAAQFSIHSIEGKQVEFMGLYPNLHAGHGPAQGERHHEHRGHGHEPDAAGGAQHRRDLGILQTCDAVIVRGIGPNMQAALEAEGVRIYRASKTQGETVTEILAAFSADPSRFKQVK